MAPGAGPGAPHMRRPQDPGVQRLGHAGGAVTGDLAPHPSMGCMGPHHPHGPHVAPTRHQTASQEHIVCGWMSLPLPEWLLWWVEARVSLPHSVVRQRVSTKTHLLKLWMSLSLILPKKQEEREACRGWGAAEGPGSGGTATGQQKPRRQQ